MLRALAVALLVSLAGCSALSGSCDDTCAGCCLADGTCSSGTLDSACGSNNFCHACDGVSHCFQHACLSPDAG